MSTPHPKVTPKLVWILRDCGFFYQHSVLKLFEPVPFFPIAVQDCFQKRPTRLLLTVYKTGSEIKIDII